MSVQKPVPGTSFQPKAARQSKRLLTESQWAVGHWAELLSSEGWQYALSQLPQGGTGQHTINLKQHCAAYSCKAMLIREAMHGLVHKLSPKRCLHCKLIHTNRTLSGRSFTMLPAYQEKLNTVKQRPTPAIKAALGLHISPLAQRDG